MAHEDSFWPAGISEAEKKMQNWAFVQIIRHTRNTARCKFYTKITWGHRSRINTHWRCKRGKAEKLCTKCEQICRTHNSTKAQNCESLKITHSPATTCRSHTTCSWARLSLLCSSCFVFLLLLSHVTALHRVTFPRGSQPANARNVQEEDQPEVDRETLLMTFLQEVNVLFCKSMLGHVVLMLLVL